MPGFALRVREIPTDPDRQPSKEPENIQYYTVAGASKHHRRRIIELDGDDEFDETRRPVVHKIAEHKQSSSSNTKTMEPAVEVEVDRHAQTVVKAKARLKSSMVMMNSTRRPVVPVVQKSINLEPLQTSQQPKHRPNDTDTEVDEPQPQVSQQDWKMKRIRKYDTMSGESDTMSEESVYDLKGNKKARFDLDLDRTVDFGQDISADDGPILDEVDKDRLDKGTQANNARLEQLDKVLDEETKLEWIGRHERKEDLLEACLQKWEERYFRKARQAWQFVEMKAMEEVTRMKLTLNAEEHLYHTQCGRQEMEKMEDMIRQKRHEYVEAVVEENKRLDHENLKQKERVRAALAKQVKWTGKKPSDVEKEELDLKNEARQKTRNVWLRRPSYRSHKEFQAHSSPSPQAQPQSRRG
ncbi:hypothetical protein B0O80DRAFT_503253 [Mortierella sp. GBAus27b]|nr:hypothetical protein B0O80DRAFT_503253 [Mortierella sp. GBAus27b]